MADVDATKNVYLFTHGRQDLIEKSTSALVSNGFSKEVPIEGSNEMRISDFKYSNGVLTLRIN